jgi:flagellar protein FliL
MELPEFVTRALSAMSAKPPKPKKEKKGKKGAPPANAAEGEEKAAAPEGAEGEEGAAPKKKLAGKTLILFVVLPILLLGLGGGAAAIMFLGKKPAEAHATEDGHGEKAGKDGHGKDKHAKKDKKDKKKKDDGHGGGKEGGATIIEGPDGVAYYEMPAVLVNIQSDGERPTYLKLKLSVQFEDLETAESLTDVMPVLTDQFQTFLRELRVEDISGSAGTYRLRTELLRRVNLALSPEQASAVLIEEMLVQ